MQRKKGLLNVKREREMYRYTCSNPEASPGIGGQGSGVCKDRGQ